MGKTSVKKNLIYQAFYELLIILLPLITTPYISRVLGADGLGRYSYTYSVATYFVLFAMLGIKNYGSRVIAQVRDNPRALNKTFSSLMIIHAAVSVLCCGIYVAYALLSETDSFLVWIPGFYVLSALFDISWMYFGLEKFKITVVQSSLVKIVTTLCIFLFVRSTGDLWKYCALMSGGILLGQIILWLPLHRFVHFCRSDMDDIKKHIKPLFVLFLPAIAVSLYKYMDKIMLGAISSKEQLGFYENAEKIVNVPISIISAVGMVMLPRMSNLMKKESHDTASQYISVSMRYVMCLSFAFAFGMAGTGKVFAPIFFGEEFRPTGILIIYLAATIPFLSFANVIRTQYLIPAGKDKEYLISVIAGAVVNLILNWALIPFLAAAGAAIGTIAAEMTVCGIQMWYVRKKLNLRAYTADCVPFFLLGCLMFVIVYCLGNIGISIQTLLLQMIAGGIIYILGCIICLCLKQDALFMGMYQKKIKNYFKHKE